MYKTYYFDRCEFKQQYFKWRECWWRLFYATNSTSTASNQWVSFTTNLCDLERPTPWRFTTSNKKHFSQGPHYNNVGGLPYSSSSLVFPFSLSARNTTTGASWSDNFSVAYYFCELVLESPDILFVF